MKNTLIIVVQLLCFAVASYAAPQQPGGVCRHEFQAKETVVFCEEEGYTTYKCRRCDSTYAKVVPAAGHDYRDEYVVTNCEEGGVIHSVCSRCDKEVTSFLEPQAHKYDSKETPATCLATGNIAYKCRVCGSGYTEELPALGHAYTTTVIDPTIHEDGYTLHKCTRCTDSFKDGYVIKLDATDYFKNVRFSEIMPCNTSTIINTDNYNFSGFIEFKNNANYQIDLSQCVLTHFKLTAKGNFKEKWVWQIEKDVVIGKSGYTMVWMDESTGKNHSPYKLDTDGGYLTLTYDGVLIDSIAYGYTDAHVSYGRFGGEEGYMQPSPLKDNTFVVSDLSSNNRCEAPEFSETPGVLSRAADVRLSCATSGALIYYTLDGTEPSVTNGLLYSTAISVKENTNIRAVAVHSDMLPSKISTGSYIFEDQKHSACGGFTVPIVSITIDNLYYNDPMVGMFETGKNGISGEKDCQRTVSNVNRDWERPLNFEYIVDGEQVLSQEVESGIVGGCSRLEKIKSISLKASKKTGVDSLDYHFFQSKPELIHQTLHLRNGGSGYSCVPFRDGLMQTFAHGMNIDYQAYQPVAYYMNGKYVGMMALHERTNADYVKANYGIDEDKIDMITVSDQLGIKASRGDMEAYNELIDYLNHNSPAGEGYYEGACERMDMDEYIDYQIFQQFIANTDWPGNNTKIWRKKKDGVFRWIVFDTDFGFKLCSDWGGSSSRNMIEWCQGVGTTSWANKKDWMVNIFKPLSQNKSFERKFVTKYLMELSTRFTEENINAVFDSITDLVSGEYCAYLSTDAVRAAKDMRTFALARPAKIYGHINSYVKGGGVISLSVTSNVEGAILTLNGEEFSQFDGMYISGYGFDLKAAAPEGYRFVGWNISDEAKMKLATKEVGIDGLSGSLSGTLSGEENIVAVFEKSSAITSVDDQKVQSVRLYPNPAHDYVNIVTSEKVLRVTCNDLRGCVMKQVADGSMQMDVRDIPSGIYVMKIETENGMSCQQFVKE